jgi:glycosyltransferase involved in cell wall biosynthesis
MTRSLVKPLRILFISPYLPSLIRVRPYNFIKYLAQRGHEITLLALEPPGEELGSLDTLRAWCRSVATVPLPRWRTLWNGVQAIPGRIPFQAAYSRSPAMVHLIRQTQAETRFDVVHVEHLRGAELCRSVNGTPIVFDSVDSISLLFEQVLASGPNRRSRFMARLDLDRTRRYEGRLLEWFDRVLVTSVRDRDALAQLSTVAVSDHSLRLVQPVGPPLARPVSRKMPEAAERLVVLPNGVDLDYFTPLNLPRDPATIIFSGKMSYHANIAAALDLAKQVMPFVWQQLPEARLVLAGKDPSAELLALTSDGRISVTGTVPDLRPCLGQATVAVMPMRYSVGIQNKVLEAMAMATPVVSTPQAMAALQVEPGREALVADTPQKMAQAVVKLLTDDELRQCIGRAGRHYVETYHDWRTAAERLETVYRQAIAANGKQSSAVCC